MAVMGFSFVGGGGHWGGYTYIWMGTRLIPLISNYKHINTKKANSLVNM